MPQSIANPDLPPGPSGKYPAKAHCRRVAQWIAENGGPTSGVIYLEGTGTAMTEVSMRFVARAVLSADASCLVG